MYRKIGVKVGLLAVLAVLFVVTAAPRGGGFGGGRGGFGGGRSGGFSSGRGSGGFSVPRSGGYNRGWYGGPRIFFGGRASFIFTLVVVGGIVMVVGAMAATNWYKSRYMLVNIGVNLRQGDRYARRLDGILSSSDFTEPAGRVRALKRLTKMIESGDVVDGFVIIRDKMSERERAGEKAEALARAQMQRVGIQPEAVNVANPEGQSVQIDAPEDKTKGDPGDACVLAILATVRQGALPGLQAGGEKETLPALQQLYDTTGREFDALYFYYAPNAAEPLDPHAANRLFLDLKAIAGQAT